MAKLIPVVSVQHFNGLMTLLYEVPLAGTVKCGDKVVYKQIEDNMLLGTCVSNANYVDSDMLEMISSVTKQELPLPKLVAKIKLETMHYHNETEDDI